MDKIENFENLLKRFFINADNVDRPDSLPSSLIYKNLEINKVQLTFFEMVKILRVKLYTQMFFEEELKDLKNQISTIESQNDIDNIVQMIEDLLPHCQNFTPSYFNPSEVVSGKFSS